MVVLRTLLLATLAACYSPEIPECARTGACQPGTVVDAAVELDAVPDARPDAPPATITLTVRIEGRGDVTIPGVGSCSAGSGQAECPFVVGKNVPLALHASPKNGWRFARWEDACMTTAGATCTLTPSATTSVRARFDEADD